MKHLLLLLHAVVLLTLGTSTAQTTDASSPTPTPWQNASPLETKLRAGVYMNQPFGYTTKEGSYEGFCVDLWKEIAADLGLSTEYVPFGSIDELLKAVSENKVDVALGNISITQERGKIVDFSQPYLQGGMQIMIDEKRENSWLKLWIGLRESGHLKIFGIGIGIILFFTLFLTIAERYWNKEFHPDWPNGLAESFYHVMSITMTGKSTHKGLPGPFGKILAGIWLAFGVGVVAYITSSVTSVMTVNRLQGIINGPQDLPGHHVGAISGTLAQHYCEDQNLYTSLYPNLPDAVQALLNHQIEAIVFDAMTLQWYDNAHPELPITERGPIFMKKGYGFALSLKSPLRHDINQALLKEQESDFVETLRKHYFGDIQ